MPSPVMLLSFASFPLISSPRGRSFFFSLISLFGLPLTALPPFFSPQPTSETSASAVRQSIASVFFIAAFLLTCVSCDTQAIVCAQKEKKAGVNSVKTRVTDADSAKSLAEFRAHRCEIILTIFLTTEGELPRSGKRSRPGACALEITLLRPQMWKSAACGGRFMRAAACKKIKKGRHCFRNAFLF